MPDPPTSHGEELRFFAGKAVLVTGGAGFIGSHLVARLEELGAGVTVVDDLRTGNLANIGQCVDRLELVQDDISNGGLHSLVATRDYDVAFHLAANPYVPPSIEQPWYDFQVNLVGTLRLLETLRQHAQPPRLILASSAAVYGDIDAPAIREDHPTVPISPYGVSKLAAERYAAVYARLYGLRTASLRFFSVYGPRQRKQVVYDLLRKLSRRPAELEVLGDGTQTRDFNYVSDVVDAALRVAARGPLVGEAYNVASGRACTIHELLGILSDLTGSRPRIKWSGAVRPGDPQRWLADVSRLRALGWEPAVSLREGLVCTLEWYRSEPDPSSPSDTP